MDKTILIIQNYIDSGFITQDQALNLITEQKDLIKTKILQLLNHKIFTIEEFIKLKDNFTIEHWKSLTPDVIKLLNDKVFTIQQYSELDKTHVFFLSCSYHKECRELMQCGILTIQQYSALSTSQIDTLTSTKFCKLIKSGIISLEELAQANKKFSIDHALELENDYALLLLERRIMTIQEYSQLTRNQVEALYYNRLELLSLYENDDNDTVRRYLAGRELLPINNINNTSLIQINDGQSTHTTSVNKSVSISATKLMKRYGNQISSIDELMNVIAELNSLIDYLFKEPTYSNNLEKLKIAERCIQRLTNNTEDFIDPSSQISLKQLLSLTFIAIRDQDNLTATLKEALNSYLEGLYEIQRGYNLDIKGKDNGKAKDLSICLGGTFNKLIEKLVSIHPDCEILFINNTTASLKLMIIAKEEALNYLEQLKNPQTAEEYQNFQEIINSIEQNGLQAIYEKIKDMVANRMFEEFHSLYDQNKDLTFFNDLISSIKDIELDPEKLNLLKNQAVNSIGYQKFNNHANSSSTILKKMRP